VRLVTTETQTIKTRLSPSFGVDPPNFGVDPLWRSLALPLL
jgi:hypothetical protein